MQSNKQYNFEMKVVCFCSQYTLWQGTEDEMLKMQARFAQEFGITAENIHTKLPAAESKYPGLSGLLKIMEPNTHIVSATELKEVQTFLLDFVDAKFSKHTKFMNGLRHCVGACEGCTKPVKR